MKILLVKLSSLGDVIQTMPVVHDLLHAMPHAQIDWVVEEAFAPLVQRVAGLHRVLPIAERRWRKSRLASGTRQERLAFAERLQAVEYDAVIDFQGLVKSALVARQARLSPAGFSVTYANGSDACSYEWPVRFMLDRTVPMPQRIHAVARYRALAAGALGYTVIGAPNYQWLSLLPSRQTPVARGTVVLAHGTTRADNEWPEADWTLLGQRLIAAGFNIALPHNGGPELLLAERLAQALGEHADIWPAMGLAQVLDCMSSSVGVVGVDSGLSHLAVALNLPHVQLFSQPRAWRAGPVGQAHQRAIGGDHAPTSDEAWQAWTDVWAAKPGPEAGHGAGLEAGLNARLNA